MTAAISLSGETKRQRIGELIRLARTRELNHSIEVDFDEREPRFRASRSSVVVQERRLGQSGAEIRLDFADTEAELVKRLMHRLKYSFEEEGDVPYDPRVLSVWPKRWVRRN